MASSTRIVVATALFAALHSALASRTVKAAFARCAGAANADTWYRPLYVLQSVAAGGALFAYGLTLPERTVLELGGRAAWLVRAGQAVAAIQLVRGIRVVGLARLVGADGVRARLRGEPLPSAPVAQGPERDPQSGRLRYSGPFLASRHPLNFWAVPFFWCTPRLTTRRLAFNLAATAYLALGSRHEERRLADAYGHDYRRYVESGAPFFLPQWRSPRARAGSMTPGERSRVARHPQGHPR